MVKEAKAINAKLGGKPLWTMAIKKEMDNVGVAFDIWPKGEKALSGWMKASSHIIFSVKMDFMCKAWWMKDGHKIPDATTSSYVGMV